MHESRPRSRALTLRGANSLGYTTSLWLALACMSACASRTGPLRTFPTEDARSTVPACSQYAPRLEEQAKIFREAHPYHIQAVAASEQVGDGCVVLVVSEPPPGVRAERIRSVLGVRAPALTRRHPVGFDGWVTDVAVLVPPVDASTRAEQIEALHSLLFGTDYKPVVLSIERTPGGASGLDLRLAPGDLWHWLLERPVGLVPVNGSGRRILSSQALDARTSGVYFVQNAGLVVWALPRPATLNGVAEQARQFALDSDLVLGAVASPTSLLIIGRERATPVDTITPLRYETLKLLAAADEELAQSYERRHVLAGRYDGTHDWAPIYLSPELIDTEFGSLLNLADQLLKGWSMLGEASYANFDYPRPLTWPFPAPLIEHLQAASITFNWNTHGAGAVVKWDDHEIYWVKSTAALPISYFADDEAKGGVHEAERQAHEFYATQDDPLLVRVVQYASMYQIFKEFGVTATAPAAPVALDAAGKVLEEATARALVELARVDETTLQTALLRHFERNGVPPGASEEEMDDYAVSLLVQVLSLRTQLADIDKPEHAASLALIAKTLANPDRDLARLLEKSSGGAELTPAEWERLRDALIGSYFADKLNALSQGIAAFVADLDGVRTRYAAAVQGQRNPIVRTPSIVISTNDMGNGGHNLSSRTARVVISRGGSNIINEKGDGAFMARVTSIDQIALAPDGTLVERLPTPPRPVDETLRRPAVVSNGRGLAVPSPATNSHAGGAAASAHDTSIAQVSIVRTAGGFEATAGGRTLSARNHVELVEKLTAHAATLHDQTVILRARGLRPDELRGLIGSCELKSRRNFVGISETGQSSRTKLDLSRVEFSRVVMKETLDGGVEATVRVTARSGGSTSLISRIRMFFSPRSVARWGHRLGEIAELAIARVRAHFGSRPAQLTEVAIELRRELRRVDAEAGVTVLNDAALDDMSTDFVISDVRLVKPRRPSPDAVAAHRPTDS